MRRRYPSRPILGVGAIVIRRGRVLLVQRGRAPLKGCWSLPGGALELGERIEDGVRREVLEETGLTVKPLKVFEVFERISPGERDRPEYHYVVVDYVCRVAGGALRPGGDAARAEWVRQEDLGRRQITEGTLAVIRRAFRKKLRGGTGAA
jgi:8-oxo-dGTP diphosphatase